MSDSPNDPAALRKRKLELEERGRVLGEQSWQFSALPFSLGAILPVFLGPPWRLRSFTVGMTLAVTLWVYFQIRSRLAWGEAARIQMEMEKRGSAGEVK